MLGAEQMIASTLLKGSAVVGGAVALTVGLWPDGGATHHSRSAEVAQAPPRLDATSDSEARQMRTATRRLGDDLRAASRCDATRPRAAFMSCVAPALRRTGMGGRTSALLLRGIAASVPQGECRTYLFGLQAASGAAGEQAQWLLDQLLWSRRPSVRRHVVVQIAPLARMLRRASRAAAIDVCSMVADTPAT